MTPASVSVGSEAIARLWAGAAVAATVVFTVFGQVLLKWRLNHLGVAHGSIPLQFLQIASLVFDPYVLCSFFSAFLASLAWMMALNRMDLSYAYPFMSLNFAIVVLLSALWLGESLSLVRVLGIVIIVIGTIVVSRS